jgi:hypothetical protein
MKSTASPSSKLKQVRLLPFPGLSLTSFGALQDIIAPAGQPLKIHTNIKL